MDLHEYMERHGYESEGEAQERCTRLYLEAITYLFSNARSNGAALGVLQLDIDSMEATRRARLYTERRQASSQQPGVGGTGCQ